jgi:predicted O-methyltransferase YrrM
MTYLELNYLKSAAGQKAYLDHCLDTDSRLELLVLKNQTTNPFFGALASLIKLRRAAKNKFTKSEKMFFTSLSLEQATSERIAKYIAKRFKPEWMVEDLTCSLGGNTIFLAEQVKKVIAVDLSEEKISCAKENVAVYDVDKKIEFIVGDAFLNIKNVDAFFIDPARDRDGDTKTRSFLNSSPSLLEILPQLFAVTHNVAVKLSPAFDYEELKELPVEPEIEIISEDNSCKVAMLWFGEFKTVSRRATGFRKEEFFSFTDEPNSIADFSKVKKYLYEPNKAISKAHLIDEVAVKFSLSKIDYNLSFLTSDELVGTKDKNIFRKFEVLHFDKFSLKQFQSFLKKHQIQRAEIIVKHFKMTADEIRSRLKIKEGGESVIILTTLKNQEKVFILAKKVD